MRTLATTATAQAQAQKTDTTQTTPTEQQSLILMRNLMRTSISVIAYLRQLFPDQCFEPKTIAGVPFKAILPNSSNEAQTLVDWLEKGVFDALNRKYLRKVIFGIYLDPENVDTLLECFTFHITYPNETAFTVDMTATRNGAPDRNGRISTDSKKNPTKADLRKATVGMIRVLDSLCSTLRPIPEERYLTIKLLYYDDQTPKDYEPEFFRAAPSDTVLCFDREPFKMKIGEVGTNYHALKLRIATTVDSMDEVRQSTDAEVPRFGAEQSDEEDMSQEFVKAPAIDAVPKEKEESVFAQGAIPMSPSFTPVRNLQKGPIEEQTQADGYLDECYHKAKAAVMEKATINEAEMKQIFSNQISSAVLQELLSRLQAEGLLEKTVSSQGNVYVNPKMKIEKEEKEEEVDMVKETGETVNDDAETEAHELYKKALEFAWTQEYLTAASIIREFDISHYLARVIVERMHREGFLEAPNKQKRRMVIKTPQSTKKFENTCVKDTDMDTVSDKLRETTIDIQASEKTASAPPRDLNTHRAQAPNTQERESYDVKNKVAERINNDDNDSIHVPDSEIPVGRGKRRIGNYPDVGDSQDSVATSLIRKRRKVSEISKPMYQEKRRANRRGKK